MTIGRLGPSEVDISFVTMKSVSELYEEINMKLFGAFDSSISLFLSLQPVLTSHITQDKARLSEMESTETRPSSEVCDADISSSYSPEKNND